MRDDGWSCDHAFVAAEMMRHSHFLCVGICRRRKQLETLTKQLKEANKQLRMERRRERKRLIDASEDDNAAAPYANTAEPVVEAAESPTDTQTASSQTRRAAVIDELQTGKRALRAEDVQEAETRFSRALDMIANDKAHGVHEPNYSFAVECRKALRGLGAAKKLSGDIRSALQYYLRVLELSDVVGDHHGDADVCGTIADLYTELDDFDSAAEYYDRLISYVVQPIFAHILVSLCYIVKCILFMTNANLISLEWLLLRVTLYAVA